MDKSLPSSGRPQQAAWHTCEADFLEVLRVIKISTIIPDKPWRSLSLALSKHCRVSSYAAPSDLANSVQLPLVTSQCTSLLLEQYSVSLCSRRRTLSLLCDLTAQVYLLAAQHHSPEPAVQVALAKQAVVSGLISALRGNMGDVRVRLLQSHMAAAAAAAEAASTSARSHATAATDDFDEDAIADMQLCSSMLRLFNALNKVWPGQAGILVSQAGGSAIALEAVAVAAQLPTAFRQQAHKLDADAARDAWASVFDTAALLSRQLHSMLHSTQQAAGPQLLMNSPDFLQLQLQLVWLQLQTTYPAGGEKCLRCSTSQSRSHDTATTAEGAAASSSACTTSTPDSKSHTPSGVRNQSDSISTNSIDSSSISSSLEDCELFDFGTKKVCTRCLCRDFAVVSVNTGPYCKELLDRVLEDPIQGQMSAVSWQQQHLELLCALFGGMERRVAEENITPTDNHLCAYLPAVIVTLVDRAKFWLQSGQQQLAATTIAAARASVSAWHSSIRAEATLGNPRSQPRSVEVSEIRNAIQLPSARVVIQQASDLMLLSLNCPPIIAPAADASDSSNASNGSSCGTVLPDLAGLAGNSACIAAALLSSAQQVLQQAPEAGSLIIQTLLQPAVAAIEACIRHAAVGVSDRMREDIYRLLDAGCIQVGTEAEPSPEPGGVSPSDCGPAAPAAPKAAAGHVEDSTAEAAWAAPAVTASTAQAAVTAHAAAQTRSDSVVSPDEKQLLALLVSSLKLPGAFVCASAAGSLAAAMLTQLRDSKQRPAAAMLLAAVPWLAVVARQVIISAEWIRGPLIDYIRRPAAEACATESLEEWYSRMQRELVALPMTVEQMEHLVQEQQQQQQQQHPNAAANQAMAAVGVLKPALECLVQSWDQRLIPHIREALLLLGYAHALTFETLAAANELREQLCEESKQIAQLVDAIDSSKAWQEELYRSRMAAVVGSPLLQHLPDELSTAGHALCGLLPTPLYCNNPACTSTAGRSELQLVRGKGRVCGGCAVARYCGRGCQAAHWQAHKKICKLIKKSRAQPQ